ncbi:MAG TPA: UDP-N-acetylglucosamine 2-epimerase (non-hydrolyzing) [Victivallales bacterium]|nr:UDP-N-acetylglucosamine 2-epimerase (non-hydrolyzing) [Victivallales bacterium]
MKIISVVGARPNFMKIAPLCHAIYRHNRQYSTNSQQYIEHILVHTGQHYDDKMSEYFFKSLNIPKADINLGIGSGTHAEQVGKTMIEFEKVLKKYRPDWVVVVGDVNATCACSITAKKEHIKCAHIEAGLRSLDMNMPEEINRLVTDRLCDLLFTPDKISTNNLIKEGISKSKIKFVGNIMIDTLNAQKEKAEQLSIENIILKNIVNHDKTFSISSGRYALITIHRPSNVDSQEVLEPIINFLINEIANDLPLLWSIHPRTLKQLNAFKLIDKVKKCKQLILLHPLGYHELLRLNMSAKIMLTDSGGIQEEGCLLGTPCLTLRWNTERPVTLLKHGGCSVLVGNNVDKIRTEYRNMLEQKRKPVRPAFWDGKTAERIVDILTKTNV